MTPSILLGLGTTLIEKFFPDPAQQSEAKLKLLAMEQSGELAKMAAAKDIIVAEAKSEHFLVAAWRPITMLTFVVIIANNYILAPYLDAMFDAGIKLEIPQDMWELLKIGLGGYVAGRSVEKGLKIWKGKDE